MKKMATRLPRIIDSPLFLEWNFEKNSMDPSELTIGSGRKVWWICASGHEWEAVIANRKNGRGCPYCSGKIVSSENCLSRFCDPLLVEEWHKRNSLSPDDVLPNSHKKLWWCCSKWNGWRLLLVEAMGAVVQSVPGKL